MSGVPRYLLLLTALFSRANHSACGLTPDDMIHRDLASWDLNHPLLPPQKVAASQLDDHSGLRLDGWCNMPPRYVLRYAEVIQRHHKRTPCQFPQLTPEGFRDSIDHGAHLREVYGTRLGISEAFNPEEATFRVTNNPLTSQVASGLLQGFYPGDTGKAHEVLIQPAAIDSLEPRYSCPRADALRTSFTTGPNGSAWKEHLQTVQGDGTFAALDGVSGIRPDDGEWHVSLDHYFDNLRARECHSMPLPCNLANSTLCVSPELAQMVYSVGNWEYSYLYRDAPGALEYSIRKFGVWMLELESHLRAAIAGKSQVRYRHNVAHDGSISSLLGFLQVSKMAWPGMGSEVAFELYERSGESWYVRVLWSGTVIETSTNLGRLDMVPADEFVQYIRSLIPSGEWLVQAC
ncbi:phosphoglycerate mutase-like protein [Coprinellus micaceus]|uniref:Phosphoglycerate mutase-like protein n=1 Tax=Coprinellus micaceus TaxID=71717 RepID=A0A4Y7SFI6_COPMI|nr:phosphoglycerate mutase-like protein [Coprinellus micaceus]